MTWLLSGALFLASFLAPLLLGGIFRQLAENAARGGNQSRALTYIGRCLTALELPPWGWSRAFARCRSNHCAWVGREFGVQGWDGPAEDLLRRAVDEGRHGYASCPRDLSANLFHLADFLSERGQSAEALSLFDEIHDLHGDVIPFEDAWYHLARSFRDTLRGRRERSSIRRIFDRRRQSERAPTGQNSGPS